MASIDDPASDVADTEQQAEVGDGHQLLFVGGCPRTGTTLLQNMLDSHPQIFGGPEFQHIPRIIHLRDRLHRSVSEHLIDRICTHDQVDVQIRRLIEGLLLPLWKRSGAQLMSEKTPDNVRTFSALAELWTRARFIHVVRDPRAIVSSMLAVGERAARRDYQAQKFTRDVDAAIDNISECLNAGFTAARNHPARVLTVMYEALVRDPERETQRICEFLDLEWSPAMSTPAAQAHMGEQAITVHTHEIWYDAKTYNRDPHTGSLDAWRTRLTPAQQVMICKAFRTNKDLAEIGYDFAVKSLDTRVRLASRVAAALDSALKRGAQCILRALKHAERFVERIA